MKSIWMSALVAAMLVGANVIWADEMKRMDSNDQSMKDMPMESKPMATTHHAVGTVKSLDTSKGSVTISHGAVKTLNWPAMTMSFGVKDKALMGKLAAGKKVEVDFVQDGSDYTIVKVK